MFNKSHYYLIILFFSKVVIAGDFPPIIPEREIKLRSHLGYFSSKFILDYDVDVTPQYSQEYPQAPIFHPYHPNGNTEKETDCHNFGVLTSVVRVKYPNTYYQYFPEKVRIEIEKTISNTPELYFIVQDLPWSQDENILFRPHYWLDPAPPCESSIDYNCSFNTLVQFFDPEYQKIFLLKQESFSIHGIGGNIVSSPANCSAEDFLQGKGQKNISLISLVHNCDTQKSALTVHWLLNHDAQNELEKIINDLYFLDNGVIDLKILMDNLKYNDKFKGLEFLKF